jgi:hypothetical protein
VIDGHAHQETVDAVLDSVVHQMDEQLLAGEMSTGTGVDTQVEDLQGLGLTRRGLRLDEADDALARHLRDEEDVARRAEGH